MVFQLDIGQGFIVADANCRARIEDWYAGRFEQLGQVQIFIKYKTKLI